MLRHLQIVKAVTSFTPYNVFSFKMQLSDGGLVIDKLNQIVIPFQSNFFQTCKTFEHSKKQWYIVSSSSAKNSHILYTSRTSLSRKLTLHGIRLNNAHQTLMFTLIDIHEFQRNSGPSMLPTINFSLTKVVSL